MANPRASFLLLLFSAFAAHWAGCSQDSAPTPQGAPLEIVPNHSVGNIKAGMKVEEVIRLLGEPTRRTASTLDYANLGLALLPNKEGVVVYVMGGDITGLEGPYAKRFNGRTKEGLGMNSSREQIIAAFGEPTETKGKRGARESMKYEPQGINFTLQAGKVHHMIVTLRGEDPPPNQEDLPAVKLDVDTEPSAGKK